jgi:rhodanese-related sulfurtransferase
MRKMSGLLILASLALVMGCATAPSVKSGPLAVVPAPVVSAAAKDSPITMANIDDFLGRPDVEVVDLRNFEERFNGGYIKGTEAIPFFQYLENRMVTRGGSTWDVSKATVNDGFPFANFFDPEKTIVLLCASGTGRPSSRPSWTPRAIEPSTREPSKIIRGRGRCSETGSTPCRFPRRTDCHEEPQRRNRALVLLLSGCAGDR